MTDFRKVLSGATSIGKSVVSDISSESSVALARTCLGAKQPRSIQAFLVIRRWREDQKVGKSRIIGLFQIFSLMLNPSFGSIFPLGRHGVSPKANAERKF
jgi:hypothetical protein